MTQKGNICGFSTFPHFLMALRLLGGLHVLVRMSNTIHVYLLYLASYLPDDIAAYCC